MSYRRGGGMVPTYQRVGPDGLDLTRTRVRDDAATAKLTGVGLEVARVEVDQSGEQPVLVTWLRPPTSEQTQQADQLLGAPAQHA